MNSNFIPLNTYFDKIYVLTLKRATERHQHITQNLNGLDFTFFYGADKNDFDIETIEKNGIYNSSKAKELQRYGKPMTGGQIGCSWSHKLIYEDVVRNNYSKVLILEDDVLPVENSLILFSEIINQLPSNWELLYLDYHKNINSNIFTFFKKLTYHFQKKLAGLVWTHQTIANLYAKNYNKNLKIAGFHMFTSAYCITNSAAQKLIIEQTPIAHVADHLLAHCITNNYIKGYIAVPKIFEQESQDKSKSTISYVD